MTSLNRWSYVSLISTSKSPAAAPIILICTRCVLRRRAWGGAQDGGYAREARRLGSLGVTGFPSASVPAWPSRRLPSDHMEWPKVPAHPQRSTL